MKKFRLILMVLIMSNMAFAAADINDVVDNIINYTQGTLVKAIGSLIIMGVGIYWLKNRDRWQEVAVSCLSIILAMMLIMNAKSVATFLFG